MSRNRLSDLNMGSTGRQIARPTALVWSPIKSSQPLRKNSSTAEPNPKRLKTASSSSQPANESSRDTFDKANSITRIVGPEKRELLVHANFITQTSGFFKTALKKQWREGQTRTISLPEDDYETITDYLNFIYRSQLPGPEMTMDVLNHTGDKFVLLAKLYILGHKLMDDAVKNATIKEFHRISTHCRCGSCYPGIECVNIIYDGTLEGDRARSLMLDVYICYGHENQLSLQHHSGFLFAMSRILLGKADTRMSPETYRFRLPQVVKYLV